MEERKRRGNERNEEETVRRLKRRMDVRGRERMERPWRMDYSERRENEKE